MDGMTKVSFSPAMERLARGVDCPRCQAWTDTECRTPSGEVTQVHTARVDKAVRLYRRNQNEVTSQ
jgi:hypothetical protein